MKDARKPEEGSFFMYILLLAKFSADMNVTIRSRYVMEYRVDGDNERRQLFTFYSITQQLSLLYHKVEGSRQLTCNRSKKLCFNSWNLQMHICQLN
jgi:hypothetical protein